MKRFEASTLEEAYAAAAKEFSCSVTELDIQVVQNPSRGFLGFGRKPAIIVANAVNRKKGSAKPRKEKMPSKGAEPVEEKRKKRENENVHAAEDNESPAEHAEVSKEPVEEFKTETPQVTEEKKLENRDFIKKSNDAIFGNFYTETPDIATVAAEIENEINALFSHACFDIETIRVSPYDDETVLIAFKGNDAALLIGKEGYRYKALAHLLYNWIHSKYGFKVRLEIAEFLQNQEMMIENYLQPIIERVENEGRGQTKVLDGILVQIALKRLRDRFPDKYVAVRTNREGGRYIIINEFMERK
ncbi:Jag N-terminal domain-containing protein [Hydrogenimonas urashimensis]|uniref:Jag N-terminal domain-containing protein n=1 Tax=Hydrogenimonas urashimensis TaxID=2740515 RepID=UPI0019166F98|nr:Jag N-terminal domain-containing protein [Hydrogenimonas urashimensis]